jgi:DedD protein
MFKSRSGSQGNPSAAPQSIDVVRRRARHRLIGASVLVLLGVLGFPLLFDTQPRPIPVDIPIVIPAKGQPQAPLKLPAPAAKPAAPAPDTTPGTAAGTGTAPAAVSARDSLGAREEVVEPAKNADSKTADTKAADTKAAEAQAAEAKAAQAKAAADAKVAEAERAKALLDGKAPKEEAAGQRIVVQVGAFADAARAREARQKLERAGLKTYTHVANTPDGQRIRVRVGPFATKAEADKAAARVKALGLPAAILTL